MDTKVESFIKYLQSLGEDTTIGRRRIATFCPLAHWYESQGIHEVSIGTTVMFYKTKGRKLNRQRDLTHWELYFRSIIDRVPGTGFVTVREALNCLESWKKR